MKYELKLLIGPESLNIIRNSGLKITLAKPVGSDSPTVNWLVFDAWQENSVTWEETYGIYAAPVPQNVNGATISRMSSVKPYPAQDGVSYTFDNSGSFSDAVPGTGSPLPGSFKIVNNMPSENYKYLTFGLEQAAVINGNQIKATIINSTPVLANLSAVFTPLTTVYVWLQASFSSGTVLTEITGTAIPVKFGDSITTQTLIYDPNKGSFILAGPPDSNGQYTPLEEAKQVKLIKPQGVY